MFDAIARLRADLVPGGQGEQQRHPRDAVHSDVATLSPGCSEGGNELVEPGKVVIGDDDLGRTRVRVNCPE